MLNKGTERNICIVGVGNVIRSDDGIGAYVCDLIDMQSLTGVDTMRVQQLDAELIERLLPYNNIVIVDASQGADNISFSKLTTEGAKPLSSSHATNAAMLAALAEKLYGKQLSIWLCAIKAYSFEIGERLTPQALRNCKKAVGVIQQFHMSQSNLFPTS